jgi:hypothetical protein
MTVEAPIDRLAAILRLDMPAAVNRSTSRMLRMGNLAPGMARPLWKKGDAIWIRGSPTGARHAPPRDPQPLLGIARNRCSGSIGIAARDHSVRSFWAFFDELGRFGVVEGQRLAVDPRGFESSLSANLILVQTQRSERGRAQHGGAFD